MEEKANFPLLGAQVIYIDQIKSHPTQRISGNVHKLAFSIDWSKILTLSNASKTCIVFA